jgi:hypothetical protein
MISLKDKVGLKFPKIILLIVIAQEQIYSNNALSLALTSAMTA